MAPGTARLARRRGQDRDRGFASAAWGTGREVAGGPTPEPAAGLGSTVRSGADDRHYGPDHEQGPSRADWVLVRSVSATGKGRRQLAAASRRTAERPADLLGFATCEH